MSLDLDPAVIAESQKTLQSRPFIWLFGITVPEDPPREIRLARSNVDVFFDTDDDAIPLKWQASNVGLSDFQLDSNGGLPAFDITIGDPRHTIGQKADEWDYLTRPPAPVRVLIVHEDKLDDPAHAIALRFQVSSLTVSDEVASARLSTYNFYDIQFPQDRVVRQDCRFTYGGKRCRFDIDSLDPGKAVLGDCAQNLDACEERGVVEVAAGVDQKHPRFFGGFRGVPRSA